MKRVDLNVYFRAVLQTVTTLTLAMAICALLGLLCSCTRKVYVPVESMAIRTDTVFTAKVRVDSVMLRDSVTVMQRGDTVLITKYRDRFRYSERTDTVYQSVTDSVRVAVPYPVERKLTRWERAKQNVGGMALGALVIAVCIAVVWLIKKFRK